MAFELDPISSGYSQAKINQNFQAIEDELNDRVLRRSSEVDEANSMSEALDMNNQDIINAGTVSADSIEVGDIDLGSIVSEVAEDAAEAAASAASAQASATSASGSASSAQASADAAQAVEDQLPDWQGAWVTATVYETGDLVQESGSTYICVLDHTSTIFADDLTALKWELFAQKGSAGAGSGDMLAANNLSDVADVTASRGNLGLGTMATQAATNVTITGGSIAGITDLAVADGGTGASTAAGARANLGVVIGSDVQAQGATLDSLEALPLAQGDLLYATGADTLVRLPKGTADQVLTMNAGATSPEWQDLAAGGGWTLIDEADPTSDVSSIDFTGIAAYSQIKLRFLIKGTATIPTAIYIRGRQTGGTWRTLVSQTGLSAGIQTVYGDFELDNPSSTVDPKQFSCSLVGTSATLDRTNSIQNQESEARRYLGFSSYAEPIDELRIEFYSGNIEGSNANERAFARIYGA